MIITKYVMYLSHQSSTAPIFAVHPYNRAARTVAAESDSYAALKEAAKFLAPQYADWTVEIESCQTSDSVPSHRRNFHVPTFFEFPEDVLESVSFKFPKVN